MRASDPAIVVHRNVLWEPIAPSTEPQCVQVRNEQALQTDEALAPAEDEAPFIGEHQYVIELQRKQYPALQRHPPDRYGFGEHPNKGGGV